MTEIVSFGEWVRQRREALDFTRADLAQRVACSEITIKKIERDERRPSRELAELLAEHLLIPPPWRDQFIQRARGQFVAGPAPLAEDPPPLSLLQAGHSPDLPRFVAREAELRWLDERLQAALAGDGQIVFITGEAGWGKSELARAFARQAQARYAQLVVAGGNCNAQTGIGDAYLPFREILELLTGDTGAAWNAGLMSQDTALRLWRLLPEAVEAVIETGPDLVNIFIGGEALWKRLKAAPRDAGEAQRRLQRLDLLLNRPPASLVHLQQANLFAQYTGTLQRLAQTAPLLLLIDDLQWADDGSVSLLFHLARRLKGYRIMLVGIYRPSEIALGRHAASTNQVERHPLEPILNELQGRFGQIKVDLSQADGELFVNALLDSEPNRLDSAFRAALHRQTDGHALFTVETLRGLQERGDLIQDQNGAWIAGPVLDWQTLPARVEGVIKERIERLPPPLRDMLRLAAVQGEVFTAEVVARIQGEPLPQLIAQLSQQLDKQHQLVHAHGSHQAGGVRLLQYRFRHILFQKYLYAALDETERIYLHQAVGQALEELYGQELSSIVPQLAWHFQAAGLAGKAITYLAQAAGRSKQLFALPEALRFYNQIFQLAAAQPESISLAALLKLQARRGEVRADLGEFDGAITDFETALAASTAPDQRRDLLINLGMVCRRMDDYNRAFRYLDEALTAARATGNQRSVADALYHLGTVAWSSGDNIRASHYHEEAVEICRALKLNGRVAIQALHGRGESYLAMARPDLAAQDFQESLDLARQWGDKSYEAENLMMLGYCATGFIGQANYPQALALFQAALQISQEARLEWHTGYTLVGLGYVHGCTGDYQQGLAYLRQALDLKVSIEFSRFHVMAYDLLGDLLNELNLPDQALNAHLQAIALIAQNRAESFWLRRAQANLAITRLRLGDPGGVDLLQPALRLARAKDLHFMTIRCLEGLIEFNFRQADYDQARQYTEVLQQLGQAGKLGEVVAQAHRWRGEILLAVGEVDAAETELKQAAALAGDIGRVRLSWDIHSALVKLYHRQNQPDLAAHHRALAQSIRDGIAAKLQDPELQAGLSDLNLEPSL
jgi:predicted ATPase/DNA-binding XRE family transcriptional regulator